jgi:hypothetical protein
VTVKEAWIEMVAHHAPGDGSYRKWKARSQAMRSSFAERLRDQRRRPGHIASDPSGIRAFDVYFIGRLFDTFDNPADMLYQGLQS